MQFPQLISHREINISTSIQPRLFILGSLWQQKAIILQQKLDNWQSLFLIFLCYVTSS